MYARSGDIDIYYELYGPKPGTAPALVFLHGAGGNHLSWWQQVPHFRARYTCLVFDRRSYGLSRDTAPDGTKFLADFIAMLDHAGIARATLVAQSMGGWTALQCALHHPERVERIVMCDSHGGIATPEIAAALRAAYASRPELPPRVHPAAGARMAREQPALAFLYSEIDALNPSRTPAELNALLRDAGAPTPDEVSAIDMPVLFIAGVEDIVIPPHVIEIAAACVRGARVVHVPRSGHSVYFERADAFNVIVDDFVS